MSKLLEKYNKSIFSKIGEKVSNTQYSNIKIPTASEQIKNNNTTNILELQKDFSELIITPYKTILEGNTIFGDIIVNPTTSVLDLFSKLNASSTPIQISENGTLINSPIIEYVPFTQTNILQKNSVFDDIIDFKTTSVFDFNSKFDDMTVLPYSNVLGLNSKFDDIIINDITSVLKLYVASKLPDTIPGVVNFFTDIYNTGFTLNAAEGNSLFKFNKVPGIIHMDINPDKKIIDIVPMDVTPEKNIIDIVEMSKTPDKEIVTLKDMKSIEKTGIDIINMEETPEKIAGDINPIADTLEKIIPNLIPMEKNIDKLKDLHYHMPGDSNKIIELPNTKNESFLNMNSEFDNIIPMGETPDKIKKIHYNNPNHNINEPKISTLPNFGATDVLKMDSKFDDIIPMDEIPDKIKKIHYNNPNHNINEPKISTLPNFGATDVLKMDSKFDDIIPMDEIPDKIKKIHYNNPNHNINEPKISTLPNFGATDVLKMDSKFDDNLEGFNFNDDSYGGVLNQFAVFFSRKKPLTEVSYKQILDWAVNSIQNSPNGEDLYNKGFHTPKVPINQVQLVIPPYTDPTHRLPTWASPYIASLENMGTTLVAGYLNQRTIELLDSFTDVDLSSWKKSPIIFQQLAGEVYSEYSGIGNLVRDYRESLIVIGSNIFGEQLARQFVPKVESAIGSGIASVINSAFGSSVTNSDKVLMLYHILMGTKYTKSKAFFDRNVEKYSTYANLTGNTAANLFNNESPYKDYVGPYKKNINYDSLSNTNVISKMNTFINTESEESIILSRFENALNASDDTLIAINKKESLLDELNTYVKKSESGTFGKVTIPANNLSEASNDANNIYTYDGDLISPSIEINHGTSGVSNNFSETDVKNYISTQANPGAINSSNTNTYTKKLTEKILGEKKLLGERGFPSFTTAGTDTKNSTGLLIVDEEKKGAEGLQIGQYEDDDLIDFYFEDLSTDVGKSIIIPFRAIITGIGDSTSANWSPQDYMGRADKFWIYQGFDRKVSLSFEVAINSFKEFQSSWQKINYLQGLCYPVAYPDKITLKAPIMALTIGNLFNRIQVILNSMSLNFDGTSIWEIEKQYQLPTYIKIQLEFTVIYADIPYTKGKHYAQNQSWITTEPVPPIQKQNDGKKTFETNDNGNTILREQNPEITRNQFLNLNANTFGQSLPSV